jgi:hypothetical protein
MFNDMMSYEEKQSTEPQAASTEVASAQIPPLLEVEKSLIWKQRFFEAQAAAEEYLMQQGGWNAIDGWIEANSSIAANLLSARTEDKNSLAEVGVSRLLNQLLCYESDVQLVRDSSENSFVILNKECGILRYRKIAESRNVKLTFQSPCEYCIKLNSKILKKVGGLESQVQRKELGCCWMINKSNTDEDKQPEAHLRERPHS